MNNTKHNQNCMPEDKISEALQQEMTPPEGLFERIEANIDKLDAQQSRSIKLKRRYTLYSISAAAALLLILLTIEFTPKSIDSKYPTIIYSEAVGSQQNAEQLVNKALKLFSHNINKGAQAIEKSNEEIQKTNQKINNILNRVRK